LGFHNTLTSGKQSSGAYIAHELEEQAALRLENVVRIIITLCAPAMAQFSVLRKRVFFMLFKDTIYADHRPRHTQQQDLINHVQSLINFSTVEENQLNSGGSGDVECVLYSWFCHQAMVTEKHVERGLSMKRGRIAFTSKGARVC